MKKIDKEEYQKRLDQITELFAGMVRRADELSRQRCPYKNRFDRCTAGFGCAYKRRAELAGELPRCTSDDRLNYRSAWET
ncbi:MAG: hypothetical protein AB1898_21800 [Acidobacteriota bacterium]